MGDARLSTLHETEANTAIALHPAGSLESRQLLDAARPRARSGAAYAYAWGGHAAVRVPLTYVADADRALLHGWWRAQQRLLFTLDDSAQRSHAVCRIANAGEPLARHEPPLTGRWGGVLDLQAVDGRLRLGLPFVLGDPVAGRLDDPDYSLL